MDDFPSLDRRDVELRYRDSSPAETPSEPVFDPALAAQLTALENTATQSHIAFEKLLNETTALVTAARGQPALSEPWSVAQSAISALDASRGATPIALANLDRLQIERLAAEADSKLAPGGATQIEESRARVMTIAEQQDAALADLRVSLPEQ